MDHGAPHPATSRNRLAWSATVHCLTGCAIGEVLGMVISTALGWADAARITLSVALAFILRDTLATPTSPGAPAKPALAAAWAAGTVSPAVMELVHNAGLLLIPGSMDAGLASWLFGA